MSRDRLLLEVPDLRGRRRHRDHTLVRERCLARPVTTMGYLIARPETTIPPLALESFVCAAALTNLAFQCSIPAKRTSTMFHANVQKFATGYCHDLVDGVQFALE